MFAFQENIEHRQHSLLSQWIGYLSGKLLLHFPDNSFLKDFIRDFYQEDYHSESFANTVAESSDWLQRHLEGESFSDDKLVRLAKQFRLSVFDIDLIVFALLPHYDERFTALFSNASMRVRDAIQVLFSQTMQRPIIRNHVAQSRLWQANLLIDEGLSRNLFDLPLVINPLVINFLDGKGPPAKKNLRWVQLNHSEIQRRQRQLLFPSLLPALGQLEALFNYTQNLHINLYGDHYGQLKFLIELFAEQLSPDLSLLITRPSNSDYEIRVAELLSLLYGALLVVDAWLEGVNGISDLPETARPVLLLTKERYEGSPTFGRKIQGIPVRRPNLGEQKGIFSYYIGNSDINEDVLNTISNQTYLSVDQIKRAADLYPSFLKEQASVSHSDPGRIQLQAITRALNQVSPFPETSLAMTRRPDIDREKLIVGQDTSSQLEDILRRVKHRITVQESWAMQDAGRRGDGIVSLFYGTSGTGKTLAVDVLATQLCLPVLNVDLSKVVSKYIGETEKQLDRLFTLAEGFRALLFFDEADSLFGQRTGIKDAHDRYANIETNFMLQRLEYFDGIAILATNILHNIDQAFLRRIQLSVHFPNPLPGEQISLWKAHLPRGHVDAGIDFSDIVSRFDLTGGDIRNASLTAAYQAAEQNEKISDSHIINAIKKEYFKKGQPMS